MGKLVDMHVHSYYSDGSLSPLEIYMTALEKNIGYLIIADHDVLEGAMELMQLYRPEEMHCISGVEIDALEDGINFHVLGYGVNVKDQALQAFLKRNRKMLDEVSTLLIEKMAKTNTIVSLAGFEEFRYEPRLGGWKALQYFVHLQLADSLTDAIDLYNQYQVSYTAVSFPTMREVCVAIHRAGGKAVLAHPGKVLPYTDFEVFANHLRKVVSMGLDGVECYYPTHSAELTECCLRVCREQNLLITCGSDCHGAFGSSEIGSLPVTIEDVNIAELFD